MIQILTIVADLLAEDRISQLCGAGRGPHFDQTSQPSKVPYRIYVSILFTLEIDIVRSMIDELPIRAQPVWSKNDF